MRKQPKATLPLSIFITITFICLVLVLGCLLDTTKMSSSAGSDKTDLATGWTLLSNCARLTDVLVVTTTKGMLYGFLGNTTNLGPAVALYGILVVRTFGL